MHAGIMESLCCPCSLFRGLFEASFSLQASKSALHELLCLVPERQEPNIARSCLCQVAGFVGGIKGIS
ncbi:hypothetical protein GGI42DRAFT_321487 [Trichoderma sp. SZMC 28013]